MATTSPDNIWTPDSGDDYALTPDLATTASTMQAALNYRGINFVANSSALNALAPTKAGMMAYREDNATTYRNNGTGWVAWLFDTGWVNITINAGYAAQSAGEMPQVRNLNGTITTRGVFASTGLTASATHTVGTLPAGFAPPVNVIGKAGTSGGGTDASLFFSAGGDIQLRTGSALSPYYGIGGWAWSRD